MRRELYVLLSLREKRIQYRSSALFFGVADCVYAFTVRELKSCPLKMERGIKHTKLQWLSRSLNPVVKVVQCARDRGREYIFWLCGNHGMKLRQNGARYMQSEIMSLSPRGKQANTHSLKSSRLDLKCVLTSWGQMGTISLYELQPFVTV